MESEEKRKMREALWKQLADESTIVKVNKEDIREARTQESPYFEDN